MIGIVLRSLRFYWRTNLGVLAGAMLASAVLTGALLVGDSVDHSLHAFALSRLGGIHFAVNSQNQYFQQGLAPRLSEAIRTPVVAALQVRGMAIYQGDGPGDRIQVNRVEVLGVEGDFWDFGDGPALELAPDETAINTKLATALGVKEGDEISLRMAKPALMSRDAPLSWRGEEGSSRRRFRVKRVLADSELGRFSLSPSQVAPYNAFVNRSHLQEQVDLAHRANLLLVGEGPQGDELRGALNAVWKPEDIGILFREHAGVMQLESERIFLDGETARAALALPQAQGTLTYLVNSIAKGARSTPYSFMVAGPVPEGMGDDEIVINRWLSDELGAVVGDEIEIAYYELLANNEFKEKNRGFTVHSIRGMTDLITEKELMPTFPGLTDVNTCGDWDVGMPMDEALLLDEANEAYWQEYRQTPKALVTLAAGQDMWANRFGDLTAVRYPTGAVEIREGLVREMDPTLSGLFFLPVRGQAMDAVSQAMDFGGLFLGMSFFLIVSALMLTGLLFVFGVQQRAGEMGTLLALGFRLRGVRILLLGEGFIIALLGVSAGAALGSAYTRALIYGLSQYWQGAVAGAAIQYYGDAGTLVLGGAISLVCALAAMTIAMWRQSKHPARELLTRDFTQDRPLSEKGVPGRGGLLLSVSGILLAAVMCLYAQFAGVTAVAYIFFGSGSLLLVSGIGLFRHGLGVLNSGGQSERLSLTRLALQNVARRQGRSLAVVGLLASGCFLVFAVAAMQEDLPAHAHHRSSGTGGFALFAEATFPLLEDPLASIDAAGVSGTAIKVRDGDDASCLNLNHAQTPRLLGVNVEDLVSRGAFSSEKDAGAIWEMLKVARADGAIPALVGDANTAMWTLKKKTGVEKGDVLAYRDEAGNEVKVKLVGALPMRLSVFQGTVLISEEAFASLYPSEAGHRMFLFDAPVGEETKVAAELGEEFDRYGLVVVPAVERLLEFYEVETTYLAMFLVLGGLGLAIGSVGMGVVVLRNLLERRSELAMLGALGFDRNPIYKILFTEYGFLVLAGLGIGGAAAAVSTLPAVFATASTVSFATQLELALLVLVTSTTCMAVAILTGYRTDDPTALRSE